MKQKLSFCNSLMFQQYTSTGTIVIEISLKNVRENCDVSKLFLAVFERTYDVQYICYFLWLQHASIKSNDQWCNFALPHPKEALKKQSWVKCCMKSPGNQVLLQTSQLIVQFSKTCLKILSSTLFMNGRICGLCVVSFKCSINQLLSVLSTSSLSIAT